MSLIDRVLGVAPLEMAALAINGSKLRIVAYHGVPDPAAFRRQLEHFADHLNVVSGAEVLHAIARSQPLPKRSIWITFDDGRRDVVDQGLAELRRLDMSATLFVCPGLVAAGAPFWWSVVESALRSGPIEFEGTSWTDRALVRRLKQVDDSVRRELLERLDPGPPDPNDVSISAGQIDTWRSAGLEIGNHTWDHPCMHRCSDAEQRRQIHDAHDALSEMLGHHPRFFAYPNGDSTPFAAGVLRDLGYECALAFDHRLASLSEDVMEMSRLRLDSDVDLDRTRAIVGGLHSGLFNARARLERGGAT